MSSHEDARAADNDKSIIAGPAEVSPVVVTIELSAMDADAFKDHLLKVIPVTRTASGCRYSHSCQNTKNPNNFLLLQGWDSLDQQEAYIAWRAARGDLGRLRAFLTRDPVIEVFDLFDA